MFFFGALGMLLLFVFEYGVVCALIMGSVNVVVCVLGMMLLFVFWEYVVDCVLEKMLFGYWKYCCLCIGNAAVCVLVMMLFVYWE